MTNDLSPDPSEESVARKRAEKLLELLFDRDISPRQCEELVVLWKRFPELERTSVVDFLAEQEIRSFVDYHRNLSPDRIEQLKTLAKSHCRVRDAGRLSRALSVGEDLLLSDLPFVDLVRLEKDAPPLVPSTDRPRREPSSPRRKTDDRPIVPRDRVSDAKTYRRTLPALSLLLACVAFAAIYSEFFHTPALRETFASPPPAVVDSVVDFVPGEENEILKKGRRLEKSDVVRFEQGIVGLVLQNGVRIVLQGPADFRVDSMENTFCSKGRLSVAVPKGAEGFTVDTPLMKIVDLGTEFSVRVDHADTEVHCVQGQIVCSSAGSGLPVPMELTAARPETAALRIDRDGRAGNFRSDLGTYFSLDRLAGLLHESESREKRAWQDDNERWNRREDLLTRFDFEGNGSKSYRNRSERGRRRGLEVGTLQRGKKVQGRWIEKSAVGFYGRNDSFEINVPERLDSFTLWTSVRIDALNRYNHTLLAGRVFEPGKISWQIGRDGTLQLLVMPESGLSGAATIHYSAPALIDRKKLGTWITLATVVDHRQKTVTHYLDGEQVASEPIERNVSVFIGQSTLGNGLWEQESPLERYLNGAMDEFMLFDKALSSDEIRQLSYH